MLEVQLKKCTRGSLFDTILAIFIYSTALAQVHTHMCVTCMSIARDTTMTVGPHCKLTRARVSIHKEHARMYSLAGAYLMHVNTRKRLASQSQVCMNLRVSGTVLSGSIVSTLLITTITV